jgi:ribonuclease HI
MLSKREFVVFDLEWATHNKKNYIIEIGAIKIRESEVIESFNRLLKYTKPLSPIISNLTGLTSEMLKYGTEREKTLLEFFLFMEGATLVAHDVINDLKVLSEEYDRLGLIVENPKLCTYKLSKKIFLLDRYNLNSVARFLDLKTHLKHRAFKDATLSLKIFQNILKEIPDGIKTLSELQYWERENKILIDNSIENIDFKVDNTQTYSGYFDGASLGNPGKMGIGFALLDSRGEAVYKGSEYIGVGTNNEAEYKALTSLIKVAVENGIQNINIFGDSQLVIKQVKGEWKVKAENLRPFFREARELLQQIPNSTLGWVRREENTLADFLSKKGAENS